MILGVTLFIDYVFSCWDFRKLYMDVPSTTPADRERARTGVRG